MGTKDDAMALINNFRAALVAGAVLTTVLLAALGWWLPALLLAAGVAAHAGLWVYLRRSAQPSPRSPR